MGTGPKSTRSWRRVSLQFFQKACCFFCFQEHLTQNEMQLSTFLINHKPRMNFRVSLVAAVLVPIVQPSAPRPGLDYRDQGRSWSLPESRFFETHRTAQSLGSSCKQTPALFYCKTTKRQKGRVTRSQADGRCAFAVSLC